MKCAYTNEIPPSDKNRSTPFPPPYKATAGHSRNWEVRGCGELCVTLRIPFCDLEIEAIVGRLALCGRLRFRFDAHENYLLGFGGHLLIKYERLLCLSRRALKSRAHAHGSRLNALHINGTATVFEHRLGHDTHAERAFAFADPCLDAFSGIDGGDNGIYFPGAPRRFIQGLRNTDQKRFVALVRYGAVSRGYRRTACLNEFERTTLHLILPSERFHIVEVGGNKPGECDDEDVGVKSFYRKAHVFDAKRREALLKIRCGRARLCALS